MQERYKAITRAIKEARLEKNMTQRTLAKKINTKQSNISRVEHGKVTPSLSFLQRAAKALDKKLEIKFKPTV